MCSEKTGKTITSVILMVFFFAIVVLSLPGGITLANPAGSMLVQKAKKPGEEKKHNGEKEERDKVSLPSYEPFIKDPSALGFNVDIRMFKTVYMHLKTAYVVPFDDAALVKASEKEINRLLKEAKATSVAPCKLGGTFNALDKEVDRLSTSVRKDLLYYAAIEGMLIGLNDPYTVLMIPKEYRTLMEQMESMAFGGLGIYIELDKENGNSLTVFEPIEGTPAYKAGVQPQDAILEINGESTKGMALEIAVAKLRGTPGSAVTILVKRPGAPATMKFTIVRENIKVHSVSCKVIEGKIGYIRIRTFGEATGSEIEKALVALNEKHVKGIILDLRNNGGGYIDAAVKVCSHFVSPGNLVVSVSDRNGSKKNYNAENGAMRTALPLLVLVNKYSASASEITAGALQDYKLGLLMGTKTYGKGSVQQIFTISSGAFKMTTAHYFTPKGRNIDKRGIEPDIESKMEPKLVGRKEGDTQLLQAVQYMEKKAGQGTSF
jgi:carboxyl-terminal processing protease